jgi:hypothetical protein
VYAAIECRQNVCSHIRRRRCRWAVGVHPQRVCQTGCVNMSISTFISTFQYIRTRRQTRMRTSHSHTTRQSATLSSERHVDVATTSASSSNTSTTATLFPQMDHSQSG